MVRAARVLRCGRLHRGADHGGALGNAAQGLAQVATAADEGHLEGVLVDVVDVVGRGEHLRLVDVVDAQGLQDLRLHKVANAGLGHDRDGDRRLDGLDHLQRWWWVGWGGGAAGESQKGGVRRGRVHASGVANWTAQSASLSGDRVCGRS